MPCAVVGAVAGGVALLAAAGWWRAARQAGHHQRAFEAERELRLAGERFLGTLAHDLRSPLSVVSLALDDDASAQRSRALAHAALRDTDAVLERCLIVSRLAQGPPTLEIEPVDLDRLVAGLAAAHVGAERIVLDGPPVRVTSDRHALRTVLSNLLDNAVAYGHTDASVVVRWRRLERSAGAALEIVVENAVGRFGAPDPERAFERSYRGERATAVTGAGLGLHLVRTYAQHLGGRAEVERSDDTVRVRVELPC